MNKSYFLILVFILASGMVHCQVNNYSINKYNTKSDTSFLTNDILSKLFNSSNYVQLREIILTEMKNDSICTSKVYFEFYISEKGNFKIVEIKTDLCLKKKVIKKISKKFILLINESIQKQSNLTNSLIILPMFFHLNPEVSLSN